MYKKRIKYCLFIAMMVLSLSLFSQGRKPPKPKPNGPPPPHPELPIDGGSTYLLFAGIVYGIYELRKKK